jgi:hypothetical protein
MMKVDLKCRRKINSTVLYLALGWIYIDFNFTRFDEFQAE